MTTPDQHEIAVRAAAKAVLAQESFLGGEQDAEGDARIAIDAYTNTLREAEADSIDGAEEPEAIALWRADDQHPWREWESDKSDEVTGKMRDFVPLRQLEQVQAERTRLGELARDLASLCHDSQKHEHPRESCSFYYCQAVRAALPPPPEQQGEG